MGKLIVTEFVSVDGVMDSPGGEPGYPHTGWTTWFPNDEGFGEFKSGEVFDAEVNLLGRVTYESFAGAWPDYEGPMADRMNSMPKYVVSTTLKDPEWTNSHVISEDVPAAIARLKHDIAGDILVAGSRTLVHTLYEHDLVDEYRLMVFPVILGSGRRLFPDDVRAKRILELVESRTIEGGVQIQTYRPMG